MQKLTKKSLFNRIQKLAQKQGIELSQDINITLPRHKLALLHTMLILNIPDKR